METSEILIKLLAYRIEVCQGKVSEDLQTEIMLRDMKNIFGKENVQNTLWAYVQANLPSMIPEGTHVISEEDIIKIAYSFFTLGFCTKIQSDRIQLDKFLGENKNGK